MEPTGIWRLKVKLDFSASHQLRHYEGKCENLHGHNFFVQACVRGTRLDAKTGILMDFKELKGYLNDVLSGLDHKHLNDIEPFDTLNPSSEHLSWYIFHELKKKLQGKDVQLESVTVSEKDTSIAEYRED